MSVVMAQKVCLALGVFYVLAGILGFVPGVTVPAQPLGQGLLFNVFAVNLTHNLAHIVAGGLAIYAGTTPGSLLALNKVLAAVFALLVVLSFAAPLAEGLNINLPDTGLHLVSALLFGYLGFVVRGSEAAIEPVSSEAGGSR